MTKLNCCIPGCSNNHRNKPSNFKFYCIPTDPELRRKYVVILRNDSLKLNSPSTRICADHWEGGEKLSRTHLPTLFPWTVQTPKRRAIKKFSPEKIASYKRKKVTVDYQGNSESEVSLSLTESMETEQQTPERDEIPASISTDTQTDLESCSCELNKLLQQENGLLKDENKLLRQELETLKAEITKLKGDMRKQGRFDIEKYKASDSDIEFYTGLQSYDMLRMCFEIIEDRTNDLETTQRGHTPKIGRPRSLSHFQEFVLVLMRLRLGLFERDLAHRFGIAIGTVSNIIRTWLRFLRAEFGPLIRLPEKEILKHYSPQPFKDLFPDVVIVVDCTEIEMERPSALNNQSACYSSYKSRPTMKALLGITPSGVLAFVSDFFPGSTSDKEITIKSNFLNILTPGDAVMADKGFNVQDELASVGASLVIPAFLKGKKQFSSEESNRNKAIASLRIHVERLMERIKNWHILDRRIPITMAPYASDILIVIGALSNFLPPLVS